LPVAPDPVTTKPTAAESALRKAGARRESCRSGPLSHAVHAHRTPAARGAGTHTRAEETRVQGIITLDFDWVVSSRERLSGASSIELGSESGPRAYRSTSGRARRDVSLAGGRRYGAGPGARIASDANGERERADAHYKIQCHGRLKENFPSAAQRHKRRPERSARGRRPQVSEAVGRRRPDIRDTGGRERDEQLDAAMREL